MFQWDEDKNQKNIERHKLAFEFAEAVFEGQVITFEDNRSDYNEKRYITYGHLENRLIVIVHTFRDNDIRIISMRKGNKREQKFFEKTTQKT